MAVTHRAGNRELSEYVRRLSRRDFLSLSIAGLASLTIPELIAACGNQTPTGSTTTLGLRYILALTGPSGAAINTGLINGTNLAVKHVNDAGGVADQKGNRFKFDFTKADSTNDPNQGIALLRQAAADPSIIAVGGLIPSNIFVPMVPVGAQVKIPMVASGALSAVAQWNEWVYRVNPVISTGAPVFYKTLVPKLGLHKIAVIYDQTNGAQKGDAEILKSLAPSLGVTVDPYIAFTSPQSDFSGQVAQVKAANPDALVVAAQVGDGITLVNQLHAAGSNPVLLTNSGAFLQGPFWDGTKGSLKGSYTWVQGDIASATGKLKQLTDAYAAAYPGVSLEFGGLNGYDTVQAIVGAISQSTNGSDRSAVRKAMSNLKYTSESGTVLTFKNPPTGDNLTATVQVVQVVGRTQSAPVT